MSIDYISKNGKVAGAYNSLQGVWYFYWVEFGTDVRNWTQIEQYYAEWRSELVNMAERISLNASPRNRF